MKYLKIIIFILFFHTLHAHTNVIVEKTYGNIYVRTSTGFYVEEINKGLIIGEYAEKLCKELNYTGKIKILLYQELKDEKFYAYITEKEDYEDGEALFLILHLNSFKIQNCLNVLEYTVSNHKKIAKLIYNLSAIYKGSTSKRIMTVLEQKVFRTNEVYNLKKDPSYDYYYQNNQFHLIRTNTNGDKTELISLEDIVDFYVVNANLIIVITTNEDLKIIGSDNEVLSYKIEDAPKYYIPFNYKLIGDNKLFISFNWMTLQQERVLLYHIDKKILIQDIDLLITK